MGSVSLAKFSIRTEAKFYHASAGFLSLNAGVLCLNLARTPSKKRERKMRTRTLLAAATIAAALSFMVGCATQEPPAPAASPAPTPAPTPAAPAAQPAPPPTPTPAPTAQPAAPKKPAVVNIAATELFEFNK